MDYSKIILLMEQRKPWQASKEEVVGLWQNLPDDVKINMNSVPKDYKGRKHGFDNIKISGSPEFINSMLSRIKDLLSQEDGSKKLEIDYKQIPITKKQPLRSFSVFVRALEK